MRVKSFQEDRIQPPLEGNTDKQIINEDGSTELKIKDA
jgi:hypothetical protein